MTVEIVRSLFPIPKPSFDYEPFDIWATGKRLIAD